MARDERFELAREIAVPPEQEICFEPALERVHPQLLEPRALRLREGLRRELGERRPAPQLERLPIGGRRVVWATGVEARTRLGGETLEALEVELVGIELQGVAGWPRVQHPRGEHLAQLRDVDLH